MIVALVVFLLLEGGSASSPYGFVPAAFLPLFAIKKRFCDVGLDVRGGGDIKTKKLNWLLAFFLEM
jgi:hypothetical protein